MKFCKECTTADHWIPFLGAEGMCKCKEMVFGKDDADEDSGCMAGEGDCDYDSECRKASVFYVEDCRSDGEC